MQSMQPLWKVGLGEMYLRVGGLQTPPTLRYLEVPEMSVSVIIPTFNEEESIGKVIVDIPKACVQEIIVVDNGCLDRTAEVAHAAGARVVREKRRGYGSACLAGIVALSAPEIVVFLDGDYSDFPSEMPLLLQPILAGDAEMVIGSRIRGVREKGALLPQARFGNALATFLIRLLFHVHYTDLGPFRAIRCLMTPSPRSASVDPRPARLTASHSAPSGIPSPLAKRAKGLVLNVRNPHPTSAFCHSE